MPSPSLVLGLHAFKEWDDLLQDNLRVADLNRKLVQEFYAEHGAKSVSHDFSQGFFGLLTVPKRFSSGLKFSQEMRKHGLFLRPGELFLAPKTVRFHIMAQPEVFAKWWPKITNYFSNK
jgi:hypothetical protein